MGGCMGMLGGRRARRSKQKQQQQPRAMLTEGRHNGSPIAGDPPVLKTFCGEVASVRAHSSQDVRAIASGCPAVRATTEYSIFPVPSTRHAPLANISNSMALH